MSGHLHHTGYQVGSAAPISPDNINITHHHHNATAGSAPGSMMSASRAYLPEHLPPQNEYMMSTAKRTRYEGDDMSMCGATNTMHVPQSKSFNITA